MEGGKPAHAIIYLKTFNRVYSLFHYADGISWLLILKSIVHFYLVDFHERGLQHEASDVS